jgi:hypothetical protein
LLLAEMIEALEVEQESESWLNAEGAKRCDVTLKEARVNAGAGGPRACPTYRLGHDVDTCDLPAARRQHHGPDSASAA